MNRRRTVKPHLGFGTIVMLIAAAVVTSSAGVFHAYVKNRQINVARDIQAVEDRISQHNLDIENLEVLLGDQLNQFILQDRLQEISSDLRKIPIASVKEIPARPLDRAVAGGSQNSATKVVAGLPRGGP